MIAFAALERTDEMIIYNPVMGELADQGSRHIAVAPRVHGRSLAQHGRSNRDVERSGVSRAKVRSV